MVVAAASPKRKMGVKMPSLNESTVEDTTLTWFGELGQVAHQWCNL